MAAVSVQTDAERAAYHADQAERLLKGKLGLISSYAKAQVHATLAVYYAAKLGNGES